MTADDSTDNGTENEEQSFFSRRKVLGGTLAAAGAGVFGYSQFMQSEAPAMAAEADFTASDLLIDTAGGDVSNLAFDGDTTEITVDYENFHQDLEGEEDEFPVDLALEFDPSSDSFSEPNDAAPSDLQAVHDGMSGSGTEDDPYVITNDHELQAMEEDKSAHYVLGQNIDASGTVNWNDGAGFAPIAGGPGNFQGSLDGNGNVIEGLYIDRPGDTNVGLISMSVSPEVRNIGCIDCDITGRSGAVVAGYNNGLIAEKVYATGSLTAEFNAGGLFSQVQLYDGKGEVYNSFANVDVTATTDDNVAGGLIGSIDEDIVVENSYAVGSVDGTDLVGGLVGAHEGSGVIRNSYAAAPVSGTGDSVGGLVGESGMPVEDSYWDTEVSGQDTSGGGTGLTTDEMTGEDAEANMNFDYDGAWNLVIDPDDYPELAFEDPVQVLADGALDVAATPHDTVTELLGSAALAGGDVDFADHPWVSDDYAEFEPGVDEDQKVTTVTFHVDAASETYDDLAAADSVDATITVSDADATIDVGGHIELAGEAENEPA